MIRFACPTCGSALTAPMNQGGAVISCPNCKQLVQVPQVRVPETKVKPPSARTNAGRSRREGRTFWALCRLSLWAVSFLAILLGIGSYAIEIGAKDVSADKSATALQALVWILGAYYFARTFDGVSKSLEELLARMRKKA